MPDPVRPSRLWSWCCGLLLLVATVAIWWPLGSLWWSGEDLVGLTGSRSTPWLATLTTPPAGFPYFRPLWAGHIKLWEVARWSPGSAHLSILALHALALLVLFGLAVRRAVPPLLAALGCTLAGALPGTVDAVAWFAAGNKTWSFLCAAVLVALLCTRLSTGRLCLGLAVAQTAAVACSENSHGNVLLVPGLLLIGWWCGGAGWRRVLAATVATAVPSALQLLLLWLRHARFSHTPGVVFPGSTMGRYLAHGLDLPAACGWLLALLVGVAVLVGLWRRDGLLAGSAAAVFLLNLPSGLFWGGRHHASLPVLAGGVLLAVGLWRALGRPLALALLALLIGVLVPTTRARLEAYRQHFDHLHGVASALQAELPSLDQDVGLINLPVEFLTVFPWRYGTNAKGQVRCWNQLTTRGSRAAPPCQPEQPVPAAARWFEYDGERLRPTTPASFAARPTTPAAWLAYPRRGPAPGTEPLVGEVLAATGPLEQLDLVAATDFARLPLVTVRGGSARLLAHRLELAPAVQLAWDVEAEVVPGGAALLVLPWTPGAFPMSEWIVHDSFPERLPVGPLHVGVLDLDTQQPRDLPVVFVDAYFPGILLPPGRHRLRVLGAL